MSADMLIERYQREQTSKVSFPQAQDRDKYLGNKEGWPIVEGTMGAARAKLCVADTVKNEPMIDCPTSTLRSWSVLLP